MNIKSLKRSVLLICLCVLIPWLLFQGCSGNSPKGIVSKYIKGVQKLNPIAVWETSNPDSSDPTLSKEEKYTSLEKFEKTFEKEFENKDSKRFKVFLPSSKIKIIAETVDGENTYVFVEMKYKNKEPYQVGSKTATKIKVIFSIRSGFIEDFVVASILKYNKEFDNKQNLTEFLKLDPKTAYEEAKKLVEEDKEYFSELAKSLPSLEESSKKYITKKIEEESLLPAEDYLSLGKIVTEDDCFPFTPDSKDYSTNHGDGITSYHKTNEQREQVCSSATVNVPIINKFFGRPITVEITVKFKTRETGDFLIGYGGQIFKRSLTIKIPPGETTFPIEFDLRTQAHDGFGDSNKYLPKKGAPLASPPKVTVVVID